MADVKPPTTLKVVIRTLGTQDQVADLFAQLADLGLLSRAKDINLNVGYYFEADGLSARDKVEALLRDHPAVMKTKSTTACTTKRPVSDSLPDAGNADDEDDDEELPLERYARGLEAA